jgi:hypothetical protein
MGWREECEGELFQTGVGPSNTCSAGGKGLVPGVFDDGKVEGAEF